MKLRTRCRITGNIHEVKATTIGLVYKAYTDLEEVRPYCLLCNKVMIMYITEATPKDLLLGEIQND